MPKYIGLAFPFQKGAQGYPKVVTDDDVIWADVKCLFVTRKRSRVMKPNLGLLLEGIVFDNTGPIMNAKIYREIISSVAQHEPRVKVVNIQIEDAGTTVTIDTSLYFRGTTENLSLTVNRSGGQ